MAIYAVIDEQDKTDTLEGGMPEESNELDAPNSEEQTQPESSEPTSSKSGGQIDDLPRWAQDMISELRSEAASRRIALKQQEEEARRREQERLAEQGKWKELAESRAAELSELSPYKERAETLENMIREANKSRIERIPEDMRGFVPADYSPEKLSNWLDANWERLIKRPAPDIDAGVGGAGSGKVVTLTPEQRAFARRAGMTDEQFAAALKRSQKG